MAPHLRQGPTRDASCKSRLKFWVSGGFWRAQLQRSSALWELRHWDPGGVAQLPASGPAPPPDAVLAPPRLPSSPAPYVSLSWDSCALYDSSPRAPPHASPVPETPARGATPPLPKPRSRLCPAPRSALPPGRRARGVASGGTSAVRLTACAPRKAGVDLRQSGSVLGNCYYSIPF